MMMRYLLLFFGLSLLTACSDITQNSGQRIDFVGSPRLTSSNKATSTPGDTLASRIFAEASPNDTSQRLTRLRITVTYLPKRDPFLYPTPVSSLNRDLVEKPFIYFFVWGAHDRGRRALAVRAAQSGQ
jgi:hypothetical protein